MDVPPRGPIPARIMVVGEAPGADEERLGKPFVGQSGRELTRMLGEAGIDDSQVFFTNVARKRPPNNDINSYIAKAKKDISKSHTLLKGKWVTPEIIQGYNLLLSEISTVRPEVILALGNTALWALTGHWGILKWRGSTLSLDSANGSAIIPTIHPAGVLREWSQRAVVIADLRRAARYSRGRVPPPVWHFILRPTYEQVCNYLDQLYVRACHREPLRLSFDLETRAGHIACAGIGTSATDACCIPFMCVERNEGYWDLESESQIVFRLYRLLTHPNVRVIGQNLLYDCQYTWKHWSFVPNVFQDTMISQHAIFSSQPKGLAFLASLHCDYYVYWKDEGKNWDAKLPEEQLWSYNCRDCVHTFEVAGSLSAAVGRMGLEGVHAFQQELFWPVLRAIQRGVRIDTGKRADLIREVKEEISRRETFIKEILGHSINPRSSKQMQTLFYKDFNQPVILKRAKHGKPGAPTCDDDALQKIAQRQPILRPLVNSICDIRTLGVFLSNFLERPLSRDGRMRCAYNIGGSESGKSAPYTYRLSSSEDAFGSGGNLQNIPSEKSKSAGKAKARGGVPALGDPYSLPNIRQMFVPDPNQIFFDGDLDRADLQIVAAEAAATGDTRLLEILKSGADTHLAGAFTLLGKEPPPLDELVETHPKYKEWREPYEHDRQFAKTFCHGTNYGGSARTMAVHTGRSVAQAERAQRLWFHFNPGIRKWHDRVRIQVANHGYITNRFGYRWKIFDRLDSVFGEALAWIPQSTVSIVINKIWMNLYHNLPEVEVLMQVHDSLCGQFPIMDSPRLVPEILKQARIEVPYDPPLVIPFSLKTSLVSWGDCK